jgi:hypothetical protein
MGTSDFYLDPLRKFHKRIAVGNPFATGSLVPVDTAAFLPKNSDYEHATLNILRYQARKPICCRRSRWLEPRHNLRVLVLIETYYFLKCTCRPEATK